MDIRTLKRNADRVLTTLVDLEDGSTITATGCTVMVPARWLDKDLAGMGDVVTLLGVFPIILDDGDYAVLNMMTRITTEPNMTRQMVHDSIEYLVLEYQPGDTLIKSNTVLEDDLLSYYSYNEIIAKGNVPWYLNYRDLAMIFDSNKKFGGYDVGAKPQIFETIVSIITRDPDNLHTFYRNVFSDMRDAERNPPAIIALRNVAYTSSNTAAKLLGSYFNDGLVSSLINPSERVEGVEELLRR